MAIDQFLNLRRVEKPLPLLSRFIGLLNGLAPTVIGATPFWLAASYGDVQIMRILVDGGADPLLTSNDGTTPLMVAAGADYVEGQNKYGRRSFPAYYQALQNRALDAIELCLELGIDINAANGNDTVLDIVTTFMDASTRCSFVIQL